MRTLDREYLATHPEGDEKANFKLTVNVPSSLDVKDNPDGTRPSITVDVTAETYLVAISLLSEMHGKADELMIGWLGEQLTEEEHKILEQLTEESEPVPFLKEAVEKIHEPFLTFTTGVEAVLIVDGKEVTKDVDVTITAPSVSSGVSAFEHLTSPRMLMSVAVSFSPEEEDDEFGYGSANEILVRS
ncbi:hypothetical protein [Arthrobacter caoxuetaonis]|uniref:Uncharacterized protein n=1 Tax=Arthrobacter caoxuetaonis TaxID=2886935 RepID=A0A9X1MG32_9MICC|nr:hypothetical protein [Arthrobacter caoxuetaonis]MCC3299408.1 hypothetical protein [Arthrobacter caoxuetaonis]USQ59099.1 hypothetical protein NF551_18510 [Arthrobacter caoxuetaonis]